MSVPPWRRETTATAGGYEDVVESRYLRTRIPRRPALRRPVLRRPALRRPALRRPVLRRIALGLLALGGCSAPLGLAQASVALARGHDRAAESTPGGRSAPVSARLDRCVTAV